jgi:hypothetical protein
MSKLSRKTAFPVTSPSSWARVLDFPVPGEQTPGTPFAKAKLTGQDCSSQP